MSYHREIVFSLFMSCPSYLTLAASRDAAGVDGPPEPEACWIDRSYGLCEELILAVGAQHD